MAIDPDILPIYLEEAQGYLRLLRDPATDGMERLRAAHGLKGASALLGLGQIEGLAQAIHAALKQGLELEAELGQLERLLGELQPAPGDLDDEGWDPQTAQMLLELFSDEASDHLEDMARALMELEAGRGDPEALVDEALRKAHTLKGSAGTVGLDRISEAAHVLEDHLESLGRTAAELKSEDIDRLLRAVDLLGEMATSPGSAAESAARLAQLRGQLQPPGAAAPVRRERRLTERRAGGDRREAGGQRMRVDVERLDRLMSSVSELVIDRTRIERRVEQLKDLGRELAAVRRDLHTVLADPGGLQAMDRAEQRLTQLEVELADTATNLERATSVLVQNADGLRRTTGTLQEHLTQLRMMPIRWLHARLQRPVRELARSVGKQVQLVIHDEATEMDRLVVEQITDPLIHLVRNAIVHGIEPPEQRRAAGKPPAGQIQIRAHIHGDVVQMEVEDDGAGIDPAQLREAIRDAGGLEGADLDALGDEELLDIIFTSGFSTHGPADGLAGRGVGLDVVRQNISRLGGDIRVISTPGRGSRFSIQMPMTTAISQSLLFKAGDQVYAIPVAHVAETVFAEPADLQEGEDGCTLQTREGPVPVLYLHRVLGTPAPLPLRRLRDPGISRARQPVIVIRLGRVRFGITCTRVVGPREIVLKGLGSLLNPNPVLAAATVSGSNKVQFVLDVGFLARAVTLGTRAQSPGGGDAGSAPRARRQTRPRILLVDDSGTIREAVSHLLRGEGYAVDTATDGREGWEKLQLRTYDLLLTDLEMPRLHGMELIERCRRSAPLGGLPIVVLTSKTSAENLDAAHQRGADAFLTKPVSRRNLLREVGERIRR